MKRLFVTPTLCIGCRTCELACSFAHTDRETLMPGKSRISVFAFTPEVHSPVVCLQCDTPACGNACPSGALTRNKETGAIDLLEDKCVMCHNCVAACPFGNLHLQPLSLVPVKCDLCKGDPMCAKFCPTKALQFGEVEPTIPMKPEIIPEEALTTKFSF